MTTPKIVPVRITLVLDEVLYKRSTIEIRSFAELQTVLQRPYGLVFMLVDENGGEIVGSAWTHYTHSITFKQPRRRDSVLYQWLTATSGDEASLTNVVGRPGFFRLFLANKDSSVRIPKGVKELTVGLPDPENPPSHFKHLCGNKECGEQLEFSMKWPGLVCPKCSTAWVLGLADA